jgi:hypothetical protein
LDAVRSDYMDTTSPVYNELNKAWKATCRIIFGEEIGELKEYEEWLISYFPTRLGKRNSHISGKEIIMPSLDRDVYPQNARFVSLDEVKEKSIEPLTINEIKDIDSIVEAISERWEYTGNVILGKSNFVESSANIVNSNYVYGSYDMSDSSFVAYSQRVRKESKYCFGSVGLLNEFIIRSSAMNLKRGLEGLFIVNSSDVFYAFNCNNCNNIMFSFNLKNKRNCIGNLQLPQDKYYAVKSKLLAEMKEELMKNKKLPHLFDFSKEVMPEYPKLDITPEKRTFDISPVQRAFSSTFKILLKKEPGNIKDYEGYLCKYVSLIKEFMSPYGNLVYQVGYPYSPLPEKRIVSLSEAEKLADFSLAEEEVQNFAKIKDNLHKISYFVGLFVEGKSLNYDKCYFVVNSINIYNVNDATNTENSAYNNMPLNSKYAFGCWRVLESQFSINCHNSFYLTRCFEVDGSTNCSDTYFAHNCEGLHEAMFCWNTKGKRYAIGNLQLPPDQYRKIKDMLVEQMADEILKTKQLRYDIFNIGCGKK